MEWANIIAILVNALIGAAVGAFLIKKAMPKIVEYLFSKKTEQFSPAITFAFVMLGSFWGVYFDIAQQPDILLTLAMDGHPTGIIGIGILTVLSISFLYALWRKISTGYGG